MLRAGQPLDAGRAGAILSEFAETTPWMPRLHSGAEDIGFAGYMIDKGWVTVAGRSSEVEAFLACDGSFVNALYVLSAARNSGLGTALLQHAQASNDALQLWTFQANEGAQRFYETHGFREVERTDGAENDENLPDIRYLWERKGA